MQIDCTSDRWTTVRVKGAEEGALENTTPKHAAINKWTGGLDMPYLFIHIYIYVPGTSKTQKIVGPVKKT